MNPVCRAAFFALVLASATLLLACGGAALSGEQPGDGACAPLPCPSNLGWDPETCACDLSGDGGQPVGPDAAIECPVILCPAGTVSGILAGECACVPVDSGVGPDAPSIEDATADSTYPDVSEAPDVYYPPPFDGALPSDAPFFEDAPYVPDSGIYCPPYPPYFCGNGSVLNEYCQCVPCATNCPIGQTPGAGCNSCVACTVTCPADFEYGPNCGCVPRGTDSGTVPPDSGVGDAGDGGDGGSGVVCILEGYYQCSAGSWCELGLCPDQTTQYGCYCNANGTATCDLSCPAPPPCTIPGEGTCPYGAECVYGSCSADPSGSLFVCSCNSGGTAYCYTSSCADGGPFIPDGGTPGDAGSSGPTCLLEGYTACNAGTFCSLGTCPDGTTQYGCFCNADGTATCDLTCPPPLPCEIPGEGTCPYGTQCTFGTCNGNVGTQLSCTCEYGGNASCYTYSCGGGVDGGPIELMGSVPPPPM